MKGSNKNSRAKGALKLVVALAAIGFFIFTSVYGLGSDASGSIYDIKQGLDLAGGVSITYQTVDENPSATDMDDTKRKLQMRAETYSTEAEVYLEGSNRINVDIPGVSDANQILEELGQPGSLQFLDPEGNVALTGSDVESAQEGIIQDGNGNSQYVVSLTFTEEGTQKFADLTSNNIGNMITIVYDGEVVNQATVQEALTDGQAQISPMASYEEARTLASTIRIGALPLELTEMRSTVVGAKLGEEAISTSLAAGAVGMILVIVFMICFYRVPGLAASLALVLYTGLMIFLLSAYQVTLTLSGVAGIVLSIGMAVDANVIIFARIKEELMAGKTVRSAMKEGFSKALSAIVDGNVTTLIAAAVLYWRGTGTIRGFAQTLALGIVLSMFTALFVTRFILNGMYDIGLTDSRLYGYNPDKPKKEMKILNVLGKRKICFAFSLAVILIGLAFLGVNKTSGQDILNYSLEFKGGTSTNVTFNEDMDLNTIQAEVVPVVSEVTGDNDIQTQKVEGTNEVVIKTRTLSLEERDELNTKLQEVFDIDTEKVTAENISATVSSEMRRDAIVSVVVAAIFILLYVWFRFKDIRIAASAVLALLHDVLFVFAFYAVFRWTVGSTFIACMLTIVGYSINATIVIFDRIRENLKAAKGKEDLAELVNSSITQTMSRTINTSLTTFIMVAVLFIMGVANVREFALPLMIGIVCGAYSSVCITGALWYIMRTRLKKKVK